MNDCLKRHKQLQTIVYEFKTLKNPETKEVTKFLEGVSIRFAKENEIQGCLIRLIVEGSEITLRVKVRQCF